MQTITDLLLRDLPVPGPLEAVATVGLLFLGAWLVSRAAGRLGAAAARRAEQRGRLADAADTGVIQGLKQRETAISLVQTSVAYLAFGLAGLLSVVVLTGGRRIETVVGASFLAVVMAFAAQRFLTDVVAGLLMFFEGWFRVGDTIRIEPWGIEGIVEELSLRSVLLRGLGGELMRVANSEIKATRVLPRGYREYELELFASDEEEATELLEGVARILPAGVAHFVRRPRLEESEVLDDDLVRVRARAAVAPGREWLADDLLPALLRERAREGLVVHGPVLTPIDDQAVKRFARAVRQAPARSAEARRPLRPLETAHARARRRRP